MIFPVDAIVTPFTVARTSHSAPTPLRWLWFGRLTHWILLLSVCPGLSGCDSQPPQQVADGLRVETPPETPAVKAVKPESAAAPPLDNPSNAGAYAALPLPVTVRFTDQGLAAGLNVPHYNAATGLFRLVEAMGSGAGFLDYDRDGWPDLFIGQGQPLPVNPDPLNPTPYHALLYRNQHDGTFRDVTQSAGLDFRGFCQGVAVADIDGDGWDDLYISAFGQGALYHNQRNGTFRDITMSSGVRSTGWGAGCGFGDLDGDGDADLVIIRYVADTVDSVGNPTRTCAAIGKSLGYCPPGYFQPEHDLVFRNNGNLTFTDMSEVSGIASVAASGLGLAIWDGDDDGRLDIFVANDQMPNFVYKNEGNWRFSEVGIAWGLAYDEAGRAQACMGVAAGDYDNDGRCDLLVTNFTEETNTLYRSTGPGVFLITTAAAGLAAPSRAMLGFGTCFFDADADARLDLFVANGHLNDVRPLGLQYFMPPQLFLNRDHKRFRDVSSRVGPYFQNRWLGRGAALADYDRDGDPDLVVTHLGRPPALLRNDTVTTNTHLNIVLQSKTHGRNPPGTRVTAVTQSQKRIHRHIVGGGSYYSANDRTVHVAFAPDDPVVRLEILWPSGRRQSVEQPKPDPQGQLTVEESAT